ncbi:HAD-IA family hydrolase [candidate division WWE3 bacterium]|uniref:HAD-IA family hydrolase n=1 Tax=candidate division WWE3 bacterium TaxID=2053526 RepID=A0A955LH28_UNCKA|nr:HAD-IA family hydrolase [candidate division WWE3 bacterium]
MIKTIITDFSYVLLYPKDRNYTDSLNGLYAKVNSDSPDFDFFSYFQLDLDVLEYYAILARNYSLHIFTSSVIQNDPQVQEYIAHVFQGIFSAEELGIKKNDPAGYTYLTQILHQDPSEIAFIDDSERNVTAAQEAGLWGVQFESLEKLKNDLEKLCALAEKTP